VKEGESAYMSKQRELLEKPAKPGVAFNMVKKLLAFNEGGKGAPLVDIIVLSRNDPSTGLRAFRSIQKSKLAIERGCFTRGAPTLPYLRAFGAHLFLSANKIDVKEALTNGIPAARVLSPSKGAAAAANAEELRIAFDGDAVLFGDEAERAYQQKGLPIFQQIEAKRAKKPLAAGPLKPFFDALWQLRMKTTKPKIRIALITSRGAPAHERPIRTLMDWGLEVDEAIFLGGKSKERFLRAFAPDFFFDDQIGHLKGFDAAGHVDDGVINEPPARRPRKRAAKKKTA
jgi:5'-nucleotidase